MKTRYSMTLLALWALFLAPFLCGSGLLIHDCAFAENSDCHRDLNCSPDPCRILVIKTTDQDNTTDDATGHPLRPVGPVLADGDVVPSHTRPLDLVPPPPDLTTGHHPLPLIC